MNTKNLNKNICNGEALLTSIASIECIEDMETIVAQMCEKELYKVAIEYSQKKREGNNP